MRNLLWGLTFAALWVVLFTAGVHLLTPVFGSMCEDCIGGHPLPGGGYYFGEGGYKVHWDSVVFASALSATVVTGSLVLWGWTRRHASGAGRAA
jgi:hypothetical protein